MFLNALTESEMADEPSTRTKGAMASQHSDVLKGKAIHIPAARQSLITSVRADRDWVVGWDDMIWQQENNESAKGQKTATVASGTFCIFTCRLQDEPRQSGKPLVGDPNRVFFKKTDFPTAAA
jgi:hypothetical protein